MVLVTGFAPFADLPVNPSWEAARALHGSEIAGHVVRADQLPTEFGRSLQNLRAQLLAHRPALVIHLGLAAGRSAISLERVAINVNDARIPDNAGWQPVDEPVIEGAPVAYFSTLPIKAMRAAIEARGLAAEVSQTAGTFVCNQVFYGLMHFLANEPLLAGTRGGFIHVPLLPEQGLPSMALSDLVSGLQVGIEAALGTRVDLRQQAGQLS